jgi:hypothetical protein
MSRSIHKTARSVFFNKGTKEANAMRDPKNLDPDVADLRKKARYKKEAKAQRQSKSLTKKPQTHEKDEK